MKSKIFFMDDQENETDKEHATRFIAREEDEEGNLIQETFGYIEREGEEPAHRNHYLDFLEQMTEEERQRYERLREYYLKLFTEQEEEKKKFSQESQKDPECSKAQGRRTIYDVPELQEKQ